MRNVLMALMLFAAWPARAVITLLPGSSPQSGVVGVALEPVRVRVTDPGGAVVPGVPLEIYIPWQGILGTALGVVPGTGTCTSDMGIFCGVTIDARGEAEFPRLFASRPGTHTATVRASPSDPAHRDVTVTFTVSDVPQQLVAVGGAGQRVVQDGMTQPFVVRLVDGDGRGIPGIDVRFSSPFSGMTIPETAGATTDTEGYAQSPAFHVGRALGRAYMYVTASLPGNLVVRLLPIEYLVTTAAGAITIDYQDMWWAGLQENGWGVSIAQDGHELFPVVFAYDEQGQPTWYVAMDLYTWEYAPWDFHRFETPVFSPRSAPFHSYDAGRFQLGLSTGTFRFTFDSPDTATLSTYLRGQPRTSKRITRQDFSGSTHAPTTGLSGMWWGGPSQNGWGLSIMQQPGGMFVVWMTYGDDGKPTWFVMPNGSWHGMSYEGAIYRASGPRWPDYDAGLLKLETVGSFRLDFQDRANATFHWSVGPHRGTQRIERQPL